MGYNSLGEQNEIDFFFLFVAIVICENAYSVTWKLVPHVGEASEKAKSKDGKPGLESSDGVTEMLRNHISIGAKEHKFISGGISCVVGPEEVMSLGEGTKLYARELKCIKGEVEFRERLACGNFGNERRDQANVSLRIGKEHANPSLICEDLK